MDELTTVFLFQNDANEIISQSLLRLALWIVLGVVGGLWLLRQLHASDSILDALLSVPVALGLIALAVLMALFVDWPAFQHAQELQTAYADHQYRVVEGVVHLIETHHGWNTVDAIQIGSTTLLVSDGASALGYHWPVEQGGVLAEGVYARLYYSGDTILRVEVKAPAAMSPTAPNPPNGVQWLTAEPTPPVFWHSLPEPVQLP